MLFAQRGKARVAVLFRFVAEDQLPIDQPDYGAIVAGIAG